MEVYQWQVPGHGDVRQGGGAEAEETTGGRDTEEHNDGLSGLRGTFGGGVRV